jgi:nucleotide-binding universal stress UspA family protein
MITLNTKKILIPIDFSKTSMRAIKHGAFIAKRTKGELILLHVQKKSDLVDIILPAVNMKNVSVITEFLEEKLEKLAAETRKEYGIKVTSLVSMGNITSEINDIAQENGVGMIVMGTQGSDSTSDLFLGSNSYRVLTKTNIPVMTVRSDAPKLGYSNILLPVDTSAHSRQKVITALQIANKFASHVHVLGLLGKNEDYHEYKLKVILPQIQKMAKAKKLACTAEIEKQDDRAAKTLSYAKKVNADLIICMRDETTELSKWILGSYAHRLLNDSKIPVLCIPPEEHPENMEQDSIGGMW